MNAKKTNTNEYKPIEYAKETNTNENKPIQINTDIILNKTDSILKTKETNTNNKKPIPNDTASQHWKNQRFVVRQGLHLATFGYICSLNIPPMRKINLFVSLAGLALLAVFMMWIPRPVSEGSLAGTIPQLPQAKEPKMHPNDWIGKQKLYPQGQFNHQHYLMALREAAALQQSSTAKGASWTPAGPENIGGRITDIAVDPLNNSIFYVAAATGGIYKTTDDGASWQNVFTNAPVITVGALAIDPSNPQVVWAGTGEANSSSFSFIGNGIYKSTDGGATWQHKGLEQSAYFGRVVVDYSNGNRVFAAATGTLFTPNATRGVYRTTDGGNTWERVLYVNDSCAAIDLVQHPTNPDILYAAMWERMRGLTYRRSYGASSGIYKSTDGGTTWTLLTNGLPGGEQKGRIGLAIGRTNPDIVYAFIDRSLNGTGVPTVFKTTDGGASWQQTNDSPLADMNSNFGWYFGQVRVDPSDDNRLWVMGVDMYRSDNGGNTFYQVAGYYNIDEIYVDHHAMTIDPVTGFILHGADGGLYSSSDLGASWTKINNLPMTQFYAIEVDYTNPERIYGGTQDNNTVGTRMGGTDDWERILGGDGFYVLVDYTNPDIIYAESQNGNLFKSTNGGYSFDYLAYVWSGDRTNWSSPLAMDPVDPQTLYFGTYRVWKSNTAGNSWMAVSDDLTRNIGTGGFSTLTTIAVSPVDRNRVMTGSDDGLVHLSTDGGFTWSNITDGLPNRWITRVAFDPFDADRVYVTVSGFRYDEPLPYVFMSTNLGQTWQPISSNLPELPVNVLVCDPDHQGRLIVGTEAGVFYTEAYGNAWAALQQNLPNVPVYDLKIHRPTRTLVAGTYGCSAWRLNLDLITGQQEVSPLQSGSLVLKPVTPNPVRQQATVEFYAPTNQQGVVKLVSPNGQTMGLVYSGSFNAGVNTISWNGTLDGRRPASGLYFLVIETNNARVATRVMVE